MDSEMPLIPYIPCLVPVCSSCHTVCSMFVPAVATAAFSSFELRNVDRPVGSQCFGNFMDIDGMWMTQWMTQYDTMSSKNCVNLLKLTVFSEHSWKKYHWIPLLSCWQSSQSKVLFDSCSCVHWYHFEVKTAGQLL